MMPKALKRSAMYEVLNVLYTKKNLFWEMIKRDFKDLYAQHYFSFLWSFIHPVMQISVYIFIFKYIFISKGIDVSGKNYDYIFYMLVGLMPWLAMQQAITRGMGSITSNISFVKNVVFPLEILPLRVIISSSVIQGMGTLFILVYALINDPSLLSSFLLLLPFLWILQCFFISGLNLCLSAASIVLRDLKEIVQIILSMGMFVTPIVYNLDVLPEKIRYIIYVNPFTHFILCYQDIFLWGSLKHPYSWGIVIVLSFISLHIGSFVFGALKRLFGNFL